VTERRAKPAAKSGAMSAKSRVKPHLFVVDPDVPGCCLQCHLPGEPDDKRHTLPDAPDDDVQRRAAGERGDR